MRHPRDYAADVVRWAEERVPPMRVPFPVRGVIQDAMLEAYRCGLETAAKVATRRAEQEKTLFQAAREDDDGWGKARHEHGEEAFLCCADEIRALPVNEALFWPWP